jgi:transcriptional regulator with XRE-family HTH domain
MRESIPDMESRGIDAHAIDRRLAGRLRALRGERGWSLETLAARSGVSRATLSRLENAEVSPTAQVLGRICAAYGIAISRLMLEVEEGFAPLVRAEDRPVWTDASAGFVRRSASPPARALAGEVLDCSLAPGTRIAYQRPPVEGLEHHLLLSEGRLEITLDAETHALRPADCLRFRLFGRSVFATPADAGARYLLFIIGGAG